MDDRERRLRATLLAAIGERDRNLRLRCPRTAARHQRRIEVLCRRLGLDPRDYAPATGKEGGAR